MSAQKHFVATQPPADLLSEQLESLGLYVMAERYQELAEEATRTKSPYVHYLNALVSAQFSARLERSYRDRLARARFPRVKTLEEFDFSFNLPWTRARSRPSSICTSLPRSRTCCSSARPGSGRRICRSPWAYERVPNANGSPSTRSVICWTSSR